MQPRTIEQILAESEKYYSPLLESIQKRKATIPGMIQSDIAAADAAQTQAYENILTGAQRRGLGFSGIPLGEQAKYASTVYAPAILAAKAKGTEYGLTLDDAINQIYANRYANAQTQANWEQTFAENVRQANMANSATSNFNPNWNPQPTTTTDQIQSDPNYNTARWYVDQTSNMQRPQADSYLAKYVRTKNEFIKRWENNPSVSEASKQALIRVKSELNYLQQILGADRYNNIVKLSNMTTQTPQQQGYTSTQNVKGQTIYTGTY
jgi:hypothetical protein